MFEPYKIPRPNVYDVIPDSQNNGFFLVMGAEEVGQNRREDWGDHDLQDADARVGAAARHDGRRRIGSGSARTAATRSGCSIRGPQQFKEWTPPTPGAWPYDVTVDKNGDVWSGGEYNDRILRLDPRTGQFIEYLLPRADQRPAGVRRQLDDAGHILGRATITARRS